jgi:hypothetical protein
MYGHNCPTCSDDVADDDRILCERCEKFTRLVEIVTKSRNAMNDLAVHRAIENGKLRALFEHKWICIVSDSGHSVSSICSPSDPHDHDMWRCGYYWRADTLTESEASEYGISGVSTYQASHQIGSR